MEAWILAKPASTSEISSSQAGEGDFDDEGLVDTPKQHEVQVLVVQSQNGANMATSSTRLAAAGTSITAGNTAASTASTAACQEPIVVQLGQATPSVTQGARPEVIYGSQPHFSGQQYTAASGVTAAQPYTAGPQPYFTAAQQYIAPYNNNNIPAWRASRAQAKTRSNIEVNVDSSEGSASVARARPPDQVSH